VIATHPDGTQEWMAFFKDCDGKLLAIMSQVKPAWICPWLPAVSSTGTGLCIDLEAQEV